MDRETQELLVGAFQTLTLAIQSSGVRILETETETVSVSTPSNRVPKKNTGLKGRVRDWLLAHPELMELSGAVLAKQFTEDCDESVTAQYVNKVKRTVN